jgi:hypothetical protein
LRTGIARGRSCAPVLVIPQRKTALVEAFHRRAATAAWFGPAAALRAVYMRKKTWGRKEREEREKENKEREKKKRKEKNKKNVKPRNFRGEK